MPGIHKYADEFIAHIRTTQQAYEERRLDDYLLGFSPEYTAVQLNTDTVEDFAGLAAKIKADFERFELLKMDFEVLNHWYSGDLGYAHLSYLTRLRFADSGRVLVDRRENIVTAVHQGRGRWLLATKIVLSARNYIEDSRPAI